MGKHRRYTLEEKVYVCKRHFEEGVGCTTLAKELNCAENVVLRWFKKYETGGVEALAKETRGQGKKGKSKNKKHFSSLEEELEYVKAERDVLKKLLEIQRGSIKR